MSPPTDTHSAAECPSLVEVERLAVLMEKISTDVYSTDLQAPGLAVRLDRLERQIESGLRLAKWIGSGGLLGFAGSLALLWEVLQAVRLSGG